MMNKGLEVIEARWLFDARPEMIEVVVHPESVVHSLVEYVDGSVIAQLGNPDMRTPIAYALGFPERIAAGVEHLDLARIGALRFERPDPQRFPCLRLAYEALAAGGTAPAVLNAANEVAVASFLAGALQFPRIPELIGAVLSDSSFRARRLVTNPEASAPRSSLAALASRRVGSIGRRAGLLTVDSWLCSRPVLCTRSCLCSRAWPRPCSRLCLCIRSCPCSTACLRRPRRPRPAVRRPARRRG